MTEPPSLRDHLISAGMALLEEGGMPALTLRRAAARAGVSHAAPAHHFDGLPGLLTAIAARAFHLFAEALHQGREAAGPDPFQRMLGMTQGYLTFAQDHEGLFHVMFLSPEVNRADPELQPDAARAYGILRDCCQPFAPPDSTEDTTLETAVWSLVHGYATLGFGRVNRRRQAEPAPFAAVLGELLAARRNPLAPRPEAR